MAMSRWTGISVLIGALLVLLFLGGYPNANAEDGADAGSQAFEEHLAYCRWADASATAKTGEQRERVIREAKDPHLDYACLTSFTRSGDDRYVRWQVRFVTRPKIIASCRINIYLVTDTRIQRMTSRWIQDVMRGEHIANFAFDKAWKSAEGMPVAARVELCYRGRAVDVMTSGKLLTAEWWKRDISGGFLWWGKNGEVGPESKSFRIVSTDRKKWSLTTVRNSFRRNDRRPPRPGLEGTDVLPKNEGSMPSLPKPHGAWVPPTKRPVDAASAKANIQRGTAEQFEELAKKLNAAERMLPYGPDQRVLSQLKSVERAARKLGFDTILARALVTEAQVARQKKSGLRKRLKIKRLDIGKPTADTEGYWLATIYFQAPKEVRELVRLNIYTLTKSGKLYGSYMVTKLAWEKGSQEFAQVFLIDSADITSTDPLVKWRAEIGLRGICCDSEETSGRAEKSWWLAPVVAAHRSRDARADSTGIHRMQHWGRIRESEAGDRLQAPAKK